MVATGTEQEAHKAQQVSAPIPPGRLPSTPALNLDLALYKKQNFKTVEGVQGAVDDFKQAMEEGRNNERKLTEELAGLETKC